MTDKQKIRSRLNVLHEEFDTLHSNGATPNELNAVRRQLNIYYKMLREHDDRHTKN